jgi:predicted nucleotidyltransferase
MISLIQQHYDNLVAACGRFGVRRLEVFGSAATGDFDPSSSDIDFLIEFDDHSAKNLFYRYFGLKDALELLFGRSVDLVMVGALRNPYFIDSVNQTRELVYAAPVAQTA